MILPPTSSRKLSTNYYPILGRLNNLLHLIGLLVYYGLKIKTAVWFSSTKIYHSISRIFSLASPSSANIASGETGHSAGV
jgi:hypothetical protein